MNEIEAKVITDLKAENEHLKRLLHDLTPMGSEFYNNPEYCAKWIRENRQSESQSLKEIIVEKKKEVERLTTLNEVLAATLESSNAVISECYGYFSASNFTDRYGTADRLKQAHDEAKEVLQQVNKQ